MDGYMREMKARVGNLGARLGVNSDDWAVVGCLLEDDTMAY